MSDDSCLSGNMTKRCTKCGSAKPLEAFPIHKTSRDKRGSWCRQCCKEHRSLKRELNPEKAREEDRKNHEKNRKKGRESRRKYDQRPDVKRKASEQHKRYYQKHKETIKARERAKTSCNPGRSTKYVDSWRIKYPEKARLMGLFARQRRRSRQASLRTEFSASDWSVCLEYWEDKCAICGRSPDPNLTLAQDHWIPLSDGRSDNPGTTRGNILPLCHGADGCNNHKFDRDPTEWLSQRLGAVKALEKLREIDEFFDWVRQKEGIAVAYVATGDCGRERGQRS
jgi:hypothetical protein